jgi:hypothetical protein
MVERLGGGAEPSLLADALGVGVARLPVGFRPDRDPLEPVAQQKTVVLVEAGEWVAVSIENRGDRFLEVVILDLAPDWSITQVFPARGDSLTLEPNRCERLPLRARLAPGRDCERHRLRVFATEDAVRWHWLALPPLGRPLVPVRGGPARNELERELGNLVRGTTSRVVSSERASRAKLEWTVADAIVEIRRGSPSNR